MTRRERPDRNRNFASFIDEWRQQLLSRRRFLSRSLLIGLSRLLLLGLRLLTAPTDGQPGT